MSALLDTCRAEIADLEQRLGVLREIEQLAASLNGGEGGGDAGHRSKPTTAASRSTGVSPATPSCPTKRAAAHPHASRAAARNGHTANGTVLARQRRVGGIDIAERREQRIVEVLTEHGEMSPRDIATALGDSYGGLKRALGRLLDSSVLYAYGDRASRRYGLTAARDQQLAADPRNGQQKGHDYARLRREIPRLVTSDPGALTEERLTQALDADREDVAFVCGEMLVAGHITLNPDGTYTGLAAAA